VQKKRFIHAIDLTVFQPSFKIHLKEDNRTVDKSEKRSCVISFRYLKQFFLVIFLVVCVF
jgi:hypothetical protein